MNSRFLKCEYWIHIRTQFEERSCREQSATSANRSPDRQCKSHRQKASDCHLSITYRHSRIAYKKMQIATSKTVKEFQITSLVLTGEPLANDDPSSGGCADSEWRKHVMAINELQTAHFKLTDNPRDNLYGQQEQGKQEPRNKQRWCLVLLLVTFLHAVKQRLQN